MFDIYFCNVLCNDIKEKVYTKILKFPLLRHRLLPDAEKVMLNYNDVIKLYNIY